MTTGDPFGTGPVRERVLATWSASPARLREDANSEEDLTLGGYRDRVLVELAQNAADAAAADGRPGRLRLSLTPSAEAPGGAVLAAANTGAPLTSAGVAALASLRASAKRDDDPAEGAMGGSAGGAAGGSVGRFGVGFAAVLAVTDEPMLLSRGGGVRFSRADTAELIHELDRPELTDEVRRRQGRVPVLRLPFEAEGEPPAGFATVVVLPLRDEAAVELVGRLLTELDDALLLALPSLAEVEVEVDGQVRLLRAAADRWRTVSRAGTFDGSERAVLFADRPTEEALRPGWSVVWALPRGPETGVPSVLHAPTPTDEPMAWPALLLATFPLGPSRRHVAPGPLTDRLVLEAAAAYADLLAGRAAAGDDVLPLVPTGLGAGPLDAAIRLAATEALRETPLLPAAEDGALLRPRDAVVIDGGTVTTDAVRALAPFVAGLVDAPPSGRNALRQLGVQRLELAELVETLPDADSPAAWAERYTALAPVAEHPDGREALGVLPVPLADGRVVRGPRGLLLPPESMPTEVLEQLAASGVRLVHADAAHPLLTRLGAVAATARQLLEDPAVHELVTTSPDAEDPDTVAALVLGLARAAVADGTLEPGDLPWLADLALPDAEDELAPAGALARPGSLAARLLDPDEIGLVHADLVEEFGAETLAAIGVLDGLAATGAEDVDLADPPEELAELAGFGDWAAYALDAVQEPAAVAGPVLAVRDLDAVRPDAWPEAVAAIASSPRTRPALVQPVRVRDRRGRGVDVAPYTAWWLRRELALDVRVDPAGDPGLAALLEPAPAWVAGLDEQVRRALGVVRDLTELGGAAVQLVLDRSAEPEQPVDLPTMLRLWAWLAGEAERADVPPPERVRALGPAGLSVVDAADAVVIDQPMWLQRNDIGHLVLAPPGRGSGLADLLDVDLPRDRAAGRVTTVGTAEPVPVAAGRLLGAGPTGEARWQRHVELRVDDAPVAWWVDDDGGLHAVGEAGLARALAWAAGRWAARFLVAELLDHPERQDHLLAAAAFD